MWTNEIMNKMCEWFSEVDDGDYNRVWHTSTPYNFFHSTITSHDEDFPMMFFISLFPNFFSFLLALSPIDIIFYIYYSIVKALFIYKWLFQRVGFWYLQISSLSISLTHWVEPTLYLGSLHRIMDLLYYAGQWKPICIKRVFVLLFWDISQGMRCGNNKIKNTTSK